MLGNFQKSKNHCILAQAVVFVQKMFQEYEGEIKEFHIAQQIGEQIYYCHIHRIVLHCCSCFVSRALHILWMVVMFTQFGTLSLRISLQKLYTVSVYVTKKEFELELNLHLLFYVFLKKYVLKHSHFLARVIACVVCSAY